MYLDILNPNNYSLAISHIYVVWNYKNGRTGGGGLLYLDAIDIGGNIIWQGHLNAPGPTIDFSTPPLLLANGTSRITFTFDNKYSNPGGEEINIYFSTPGCDETNSVHVKN